MNRRNIASIFLSFVVGVAVAIFVPPIVRPVVAKIFPVHWEEAARKTSPDGSVDAVLQSSDCGAPCSLEYSVSIVPKGGKVPVDQVQNVFLGSDVVSPQIRWQKPHLLEIAYDRAFIESFRNVTNPFGKFGDEGSWQYTVEIRLALSSPDFSYLKDRMELKP